MNSACTWQVLARQIVSVLSINSTQTHWVNPPLPPVCGMDLEAMKTLFEAQMGVINQQMEVIWCLEAQVQELNVIALKAWDVVRNLREPQGNTLGNPIVIEGSDEESEDEVEVIGAGPQIVTEPILIKDD